MTKLLEDAFSQAKALPDSEQDYLAKILLDEIESDRRWDELLSKTSPELERMGEQALAEFRAGRTEELDPDRM